MLFLINETQQTFYYANSIAISEVRVNKSLVNLVVRSLGGQGALLAV